MDASVVAGLAGLGRMCALAASTLSVSHHMSSMIIFCRSFSEGSVFQINYFKKGAEMFSKSMDNFLSSVVDMVQR